MFITKVKLLLTLVLLLECTRAVKYTCSVRSTTLLLRKHVYNFSMEILHRVSLETNGHFVFSPLSTWLQMGALAEGANGRTLREIRKITRHTAHGCFKRQLSKIMYKMNNSVKRESSRKSMIVIDSLMDVKRPYMRNVHDLYGSKVFLKNFYEPAKTTAELNKMLQARIGGIFTDAFYYDDFLNTSLLMTEVNYFSSSWKYRFDPRETKPAAFSGDKNIGTVNMMSQLGYFNYVHNPLISANILELPLADGRFSFLVFLPTKGRLISELFYNLRSTSLTSIFNMMKLEGQKLVSVQLPRFQINTSVENLPELLYDMGVKRIFYPDLAELKSISDYNIYVSLMTQLSHIEVTEKGVAAEDTAKFLVRDEGTVHFVANQTFGFIIVDKITQFILYSGIYSLPSPF